MAWGVRGHPVSVTAPMHAKERLGDIASPAACHKILREPGRVEAPPSQPATPREAGLCYQGSANVFGMQGEILSLPRKKIKLFTGSSIIDEVLMRENPFTLLSLQGTVS